MKHNIAVHRRSLKQLAQEVDVDEKTKVSWKEKVGKLVCDTFSGSEDM